MITYHQAKDELDRRILDGLDVGGSGPALAIFRFLLSHTFYKGDSYGWVRDDRSSVDKIAQLTGYSVRTVKDHLQSLERVRLIRRYKRPKATGGRWPDRVFISWDYVHAAPAAEHDSEGAAPALMESAAPSESAAPALSYGAAPAPSYIPQEKVKNYDQERGQARVFVGGTSTPSGKDRAKDRSRGFPLSRPILDLLADGCLSLTTASVRLGQGRRSRAVQLTLNALVADGKVTRKGDGLDDAYYFLADELAADGREAA